MIVFTEDEVEEPEESNNRPLPPNIKTRGMIEYQLGSDDKLQRLTIGLIGGFWKETQKGKVEFVKTGSKKINSEGINDILLLIDSTIGKEISLAHMTENQLLMIMRRSSRIIIRTIWDRNLRKKYEIDLDSKDFILGSLMNIIHFCISRAKDGTTNRLINANINVSEQSTKQKIEPVVKNKGFSLFNGDLG